MMEQQIENLIKDLIQNHGTIPYVEYYSHEGGDCFKIDNPYTDVRKETLVLCSCNETFLSALIAAKTLLDKKKVAFFGGSFVKG